MTTRAIAIFVKTLGLSPIKTRLAEGIGEAKAQKFYQLALDCVKELVRDVDATPYWAVGEEDGLSHPCWQNSERLWTGDGDLGERQHHIYSTLLQQYDEVMLLGTDCPQLSPANIEAGFETLNTHDFAFGPARDGGYNFFAGRKNVPLETWENVEYSQNDTRAQLNALLPGTAVELSQYSDVDEKTDLQSALNEMPAALSPSQRKLVEWIEAL